MKLRQTHYDQILSMIDDRRDTGWYYGNKEQFEKREREIMLWAQYQLDLLEGRASSKGSP